MDTNLFAHYALIGLNWYASMMNAHPYQTVLVTVLAIALVIAYLPKPKNQY